MRELGHLDILVSNAAWQNRKESIEKISDDEWRRTSLAQELVPKGIRVNAVAPGPVWTPLNPADQGMTPEKIEKFGGQQPIGRAAQPEEIAPAYVFLASDADSSDITGIVLQEMGELTTGG